MVKDGIDVSQYQGEINWELVKNHIDFANFEMQALVRICLDKMILLLNVMLMNVQD